MTNFQVSNFFFQNSNEMTPTPPNPKNDPVCICAVIDDTLI